MNDDWGKSVLEPDFCREGCSAVVEWSRLKIGYMTDSNPWSSVYVDPDKVLAAGSDWTGQPRM